MKPAQLDDPVPDKGRRVWLFDLDNTLHDASWRIFGELDRSMTSYIEHHLGLDAGAANLLRRHYWLRYGATLTGLMHHHGIERDHFLASTHAFIEDDPGTALIRAERGLARNLRRLPGRKLLLTNAPARYAQIVLREVGVARHFARSYAIENMQVHGRLRAKPSRAMLRMVLAREKIRPARAILVEDSPANLKSARALRVSTVLVTGYGEGLETKRKSRPPYVDLQVKSIAQLVNRQRQVP